LLVAQGLGKPVMLDFYADWCESCIDMDKNVFNMKDVLTGLNKFVLLRADLSRNTAADEDLLRNFDSIAPPTVLFFNNQGHEVNSHRIVGELNAKEFMTRINTFITASCDKKMTC
jgi:thiol:disulfide interchange protein DsbD